MPWQAAPSLLIIIGAFNVAAGLIWSVDRAYYGKVRLGGGGFRSIFRRPRSDKYFEEVIIFLASRARVFPGIRRR
jgi:hypothetical protein